MGHPVWGGVKSFSLTIYKKINFYWIKDLNVKSKSKHFLKKYEHLHYLLLN